MTSGKIEKLIMDRGFGFIRDEQNQQYFFHMSAIDPKSKLKFEHLQEGQEVQFTSEDAEKGPRVAPRTLSLAAGVN